MNGPGDDTTETGARVRRKRGPGDYYYDDGMGYEVYTPDDEDVETSDEGGEPRPPAGQTETAARGDDPPSPMKTC